MVLSHWRGRLCVASTPVELAEVPTLIGVLVEALNEAASSGTEPRTPQEAGFADVAAALRRWLRPRLAQIRELRPRPGSGADEHAS